MPQPVIVLLRQSLMLKAALAACLEKPKPKSVHQLRSATRRIEALLELLTRSADVPGIKRQSKPFRRSLRKIRRAAGKVRDFDVHRELLDGYRNRSRDSKKTDDLAALDKQLADAREKAVEKLQEKLRKRQNRIQQELDELEVALQPALDFSLSGGELAAFARKRFAETVHVLDLQRDDDLHAVRKACKTARYMVEVGKDTSKVAARTASRFESHQQALGDWHDRLLLLEEAKESLDSDGKTLRKIQADTARLRQRADSMAKRLVAAI